MERYFFKRGVAREMSRTWHWQRLKGCCRREVGNREVGKMEGEGGGGRGRSVGESGVAVMKGFGGLEEDKESEEARQARRG